MSRVVPLGRSVDADESAAEPRSAMRGLVQIDADITALDKLLFNLRLERRRFKTARRHGVVRDFDAGKRVEVIAETWGVAPSFVTRILYVAGRSERRRNRQRKLKAT